MSGKFTVCAEAKRLLTLILSPTRRGVAQRAREGGVTCVCVCVCVIYTCVCVCVGAGDGGMMGW